MIAATFGNVQRMLQIRPERGWRDTACPKTNLNKPTNRIAHQLNTLVKGSFVEKLRLTGGFPRAVSPARWLRQRSLRSSGLKRVEYGKYNGVS